MGELYILETEWTFRCRTMYCLLLVLLIHRMLAM